VVLRVGALSFTVSRTWHRARRILAVAAAISSARRRTPALPSNDRPFSLRAACRDSMISRLADRATSASKRRRAPTLPIGRGVHRCAERLLGIYTINLPDGVDDFVDPTLVTIGVCLLVSLLYLLTVRRGRRLSQKGTSTSDASPSCAPGDRSPPRSRDARLLRAARRQAVLLLSRLTRCLRGLRRVALISPDPIGPSRTHRGLQRFRSYGGRTLDDRHHGASEEWTLSTRGGHALHLPRRRGDRGFRVLTRSER